MLGAQSVDCRIVGNRSGEGVFRRSSCFLVPGMAIAMKSLHQVYAAIAVFAYQAAQFDKENENG